jgi:hypothetical protein
MLTTINPIVDPVAYNGVPVMTTEMLAQAYGTEVKNIQMNFSRNSERFTEGTHFFKVAGAELKALKDSPTMSGSVDPRTPSLILWTEKGAARHAKILDTDEAWAVYEKLEDTYFAAPRRPTELRRDPSLMIDFMRLALEHFPNLGEKSRQLMFSETSVALFGDRIIEKPLITEPSWTTTEIAKELGKSPQTLGKIVTAAGLKNDLNGSYRLSKALHSNKDVEQFYWNARGRAILLELCK